MKSESSGKNAVTAELFPRDAFPRQHACPVCRHVDEHLFDDAAACYRCSRCCVAFTLDPLGQPVECPNEPRHKLRPQVISDEDQQRKTQSSNRQFEQLAALDSSEEFRCDVSSDPGPPENPSPPETGPRRSDVMREIWRSIRRGEFVSSRRWPPYQD